MERNLAAGPEAAVAAKLAEMASEEAPIACDPQRLLNLQQKEKPVAPVGAEPSAKGSQVVEGTSISDVENTQSSAAQNTGDHLAADLDGTFADAAQPSVHTNYMEDSNVAGIRARLVRAE